MRKPWGADSVRIVAIADTHTHERELGRLPEGDLLIHAGDMLRQGTLEELGRFSEWVRAQPHRFKVVVAGNDDWCFLQDRANAVRALGHGVTYLQDASVEISGLNLWGSPWVPEYKNGAFNLPRGDALREKWALIPGSTHVLVTHGPPRDIGDRTLVGRNGCDDLRAAVAARRPSLHLFGHAHADGGVWREGHVCYANVTTWNGRRGATVLDIDLVSKTIREVVVP